MAKAEREAVATELVRRLRAAGHEAYLAGGCVRDRLLGREPLDYDVATSAAPEAVQALFPRTIPVGVQFGVILVVAGGMPVEVATFRSDSASRSSPRPSRRFAPRPPPSPTWRPSVSATRSSRSSPRAPHAGASSFWPRPAFSPRCFPR